MSEENHTIKRYFIGLIIFVCISNQSFSQKDLIPDSLHQIVAGARLHSGFIFAHSIRVRNTKDTHPAGFELEYAHVRTDSATYAHVKCFPQTGVSFNYTDFNKSFLGRSYSVAYFIQPNYRLGNKFQMHIRGSAGFSYLTNPNDSAKNPQNQTYSLPVNIYLQFGLGFSYPLSAHFSMYAMSNFFHNSNGGFKQPNRGLNYINASLGILYYRYSNKLPYYKKTEDKSWKNEPLHYDAALFYSPKSGYNENKTSERKFVAGVYGQVAKQVSNIDALTAAAEIYYDDGMRSVKKVFLNDNSSNTLAGVLLGHEFLFNRFIFSQQLGIYVFKRTGYYNAIYYDLYHTLYHRWGLRYKIKEHWYVGFSLLAHDEIADFVDGRLIYRF